MNFVIALIKKYASIINYAFFGVLTTIINVFSYYLCCERLGLNNISGTIISWFTAVSFAFVTNKLYVFDSKKWDKNTVKEIVDFFIFRILVGIVELTLMLLLVDVMHLNGTLMKFLTNIVAIILNYLASKFIVFSKETI